MNTKKKGISLIVLVITIIVMIILAAAIILTLSNNKIMDSANNAVADSNLKEVQTAASLGWMEAYMNGAKTVASLQEGVDSYLAANGIATNQYNIAVTVKGVEVTAKAEGTTPTVPAAWSTNVITIVDTVPIPRGFVASSVSGENTKAGGLVIYEGSEPVTNANVTTAKTTRNQYVWIPVDKDNFTLSFTRRRRLIITYNGYRGYILGGAS